MACHSLYFLPSEVARLVLGYLQSEGYVKTYKNFVKECPHLSEYVNFMKRGQYYPLTINGLALMQMLEEYGALRVAETSKKLTPNPTLTSLWCQLDSVVDNIKKQVVSNSKLVYKGSGNQKARTRLQMAERRRNQIKVTNVDPDIIQPHSSKTPVKPLVVTQTQSLDKLDSDYTISQPSSPSDGGGGCDDNDCNLSEMSVDDRIGAEITDLPTAQPTKEKNASETSRSKGLQSPRTLTECVVQGSEKYDTSDCTIANNGTELCTGNVSMVPCIPSATMTVTTGPIHTDTEMTNAPGSPTRSVGLVSTHKTPVKNSTTLEPALEKSPRRKRPPKRKPQGELCKQNKSDSSIAHGIGSQNESSNSTDGSALENSFPQILEHIMNDPLLPHKLAENINKSLHPEVIPDPGTPAALPPVDSIPESPFMGRSLEDILDQQETQMPASSINGIIELTEKDPNFEWLFSAGVSYLDEATHDRDFIDGEHKSRSNGLLQSSTRTTTPQPQPGTSGCKVDPMPTTSRSFVGLTSENIPFTTHTDFMPISEDTENNLFKISVPNFSNTPTSNAESFHRNSQYSTTKDETCATQLPITHSVTSSSSHQPMTSNVTTQVPMTICDSASQGFATSATQSVTMCVTAQALATVATSHQPITSRPSSQPITTAVTSIQPITSSFSTGYGKETVESTLVTSPHGFPVLSLRSSVSDDELPDPLSSFTIQSPAKPCTTNHTRETTGITSSASYSSFVSDMKDGQHSSTPITVRANTGLVLPCVTGSTSSQESTKLSSDVQSTSLMVFAKPQSAVPTTSPKSLPTINLRSLMDKLEAKAKGEIVDLDLQPKPAAKPSSKGRGRKRNPPAKKSSPKPVQPKPLNPSDGWSWSSELSALVKITSPEKSTPKETVVKRSRVTRSSAAKMSSLNSDKLVPQTRKTKSKKGNETIMAVLSPGGNCVHHVPVVEVNSLSEFSDAKDLVPMGQLVPTSIPMLTSSVVSMTTAQSLVASSLSVSSNDKSMSASSVTSSLQTESMTTASCCLPLVQTDAPQTPPTNTSLTEYPSMPDLYGSQPSLPVSATTRDKTKDKKTDPATVLNDVYSADRDFLESPSSSMAAGDYDLSAPTDYGKETGVKPTSDDLNVYCGVPVEISAQKDICTQPLDFGSAVHHSSLTQVSSPVRQTSIGRGKKTPVTKKSKKGRPPGRTSTRRKAKSGANEEITNTPKQSREVKKASKRNVLSPTSCDQYDSCTDSIDEPPTQQDYDAPLPRATSEGTSPHTPSHAATKATEVTPCQDQSRHDPFYTPLPDIDNSPAGTPNKLTICTPSHTDDVPVKGAASQVLTLGNVGAISLHEVVNSPSYEDMASRDSILSKQAQSPSVQGPGMCKNEQESSKNQIELSKDVSNVKLTENCNYEDMEISHKNPLSHDDSAENIQESEVSNAVLSIQESSTSLDNFRSNHVNMLESQNTAADSNLTSQTSHTYQEVSVPSPDTHQQPVNSTDKESEITIHADNQHLSTEVNENSQHAASKDTIQAQHSELNNQSVTCANSCGSSYSQTKNFNENKCDSIRTTVNHSHVVNQSQSCNIDQSQSGTTNQSQSCSTNQSQDNVINQSADYQNIPNVPESVSSTSILEDALKQVFSSSEQQQALFNQASVVTGTQLMVNASTDQQLVSCTVTPGLVVSSPAPAVNQTQFVVYSPVPNPTVQSTSVSTPAVHSAAQVLPHSQFIVNSPASVIPAPFIVPPTAFPATPVVCHSQLILNSPTTPVMVKSPATPLIVNSPATPQVKSPVGVMTSAPYKSMCSPAPHKAPSRAPTPQMEPADFIPDRSGTIYVTPNVLAQMSCEKGLVVQQDRAASTTSSAPCPPVGHPLQGPDINQSPRGQYQSDQDIFAETTDEEVAEPAPVLPAPSKLPTITEVSHDIAKIPSLFDTMDGHNQVMIQTESTQPPCGTGRESPRYFSALSNSNDIPVNDQSEISPSSPVNNREENLQNYPSHSAKPDVKVLQQSDSDDDIDIMGDWDHNLSAGEITNAPITEHTISHDSKSVCNVSCSPKKSAWQTGFATKSSSTTSAFIRKILEQKNTQQSSRKESPKHAESVSLKTQTISQATSPGHSASSSSQNKPADHHAKEKGPRRVQVITLSKEVSKVSKDDQSAVQSARGPFKHPQELTPRKSSHSSSKLTNHAKRSNSNEKDSGGGHSAEKDTPPNHQQYITPPKKRFTASLKSGDGLYFVSSAEKQGNTSTGTRSHSHPSEGQDHNSSAKVSIPGQSPQRSRKSTLTPRKDIDSGYMTQRDLDRTERISDSLSCHGRSSKSPARASLDHGTLEGTSRSPSHRKSSNRRSQSPSHKKFSNRTSQSPSHRKSTDRTSQSHSRHKSGRSSPNSSPHRTVHNRTSESPIRSRNLDRVNASPSIRRKVFETSVNIEKGLGKSEDRGLHVNTNYDKDNRNSERGHTSLSVSRSSSSSSSHHRPSGSGTSNKDVIQKQPTSPAPKRGHKRQVDSYPGGEVNAKRAKKSNKQIDLTKLDVDKFLNSDTYKKDRCEK